MLFLTQFLTCAVGSRISSTLKSRKLVKMGRLSVPLKGKK